LIHRLISIGPVKTWLNGGPQGRRFVHGCSVNFS
jgi:hypothetical protein